MTLLVDQNEPAVLDLYVQGHGLSTERLLLNRPSLPPKPDYGFYAADGSYIGISRKQAGEFIAGMDACEAQLLDELGGCDYMALIIEGRFKASPHGGCYTYQYGREVLRDRGDAAYGTTETVRRHYRVDYKHVREQLARYWLMGIEILETEDVEDTALAITSLYRECQKSISPTFKRLIPERYRLDEKDADRKRFVLQVMQSVPGGGEELGHALYDAGFRTLTQLIRCFDQYEVVPFMDWQAIAKLPLRSGKRTIGQAAVKRIRDALGC